MGFRKARPKAVKPPPPFIPQSRFMVAALKAAHATRGQTWPNPTVGCVLVDPKTNTIIAEGCTQKGGRPHAEADALGKIDKLPKDCVCYVTLEPCNHMSLGKTQPCTDALITAGVKKIIIAMPDPDPRMMGKSIERLKSAGLEVYTGWEIKNAYHAFRGHITRILLNRPYITLKLAHSKDGKLGMPNMRTPISCEASWQRTYIQRGKVDAVVIGIETALVDDPQLTNRNAPANHQPVRVVVDTHARLKADSKLAQTARETPVWLLTASDNTKHLSDLGVRIIKTAMDIDSIVKTLYDAGLSHILVEGGAKLAASFINAEMVDEALMIEGNVVLGEDGITAPALKGMKLRNMDRIGVDQWFISDSLSSLEMEKDFYETARSAGGIK